MKYFLITIFTFLAFQTQVEAQLDRSKRPVAGPAPEIRFGKAESFQLDNGLKVFVITNDKLPRVTFSLIIDRDPIAEGDKAGMTSLVGEMLTAGTKNRSKDELNESIDFLGARINASSSSLTASTLTKHTETVMELMADILYNPLFPAEELEKLKTQSKSGLAVARNDASSISGVLRSKVVYGSEHPYGENETEETIDNITVEDIKSYYNTYFKPNMAYLAIVGDIDRVTAERLVKQHFSRWKKGDKPAKPNYSVPSVPDNNQVALVDRSSANQSVISVTYPIKMSMDHPDYLATRVVDFILGGGASSRLFLNLREDKGFTYGAYSSIGADKLIASFAAGSSVGTDVTADAIKEIIFEMEKISKEGISAGELEAAKANISGNFARSLESPSTIAGFAINTERYNLPADYYSGYLQRLSNLTIADVNKAAEKFILPGNMYITVVGNASKIKESLEQFGPVKMYTTSGDPAKEAQAVSADVTGSKVIADYIKAIGGTAKVGAIQTARIESAAEVQGMTLAMSIVIDDTKGRMANKMSMMGNVMQSMIVKDGQAIASAMGQSQTMSEEEFEDARMDFFIFPEFHYEQLGYTSEVDGIHEIEGENAYKLVVTNPSGGQRIAYYSVASGLKLKSESQQNGDILYKDYQEFNGVLYPMTQEISSPAIPFPLKNVIEEVTFNGEVSEEDFK